VKLYLSSYRLGREPDRLRRLVERGDRAGIILNACDVFEWRSDHPEAASAELAVGRLDAAGLEYRALTDGDAIVIDNP